MILSMNKLLLVTAIVLVFASALMMIGSGSIHTNINSQTLSSSI